MRETFRDHNPGIFRNDHTIGWIGNSFGMMMTNLDNDVATLEVASGSADSNRA